MNDIVPTDEMSIERLIGLGFSPEDSYFLIHQNRGNPVKILKNNHNAGLVVALKTVKELVDACLKEVG